MGKHKKLARRRGLSVRVGDRTWVVREDQSLVLGRKTGEPALSAPYISRRHLRIWHDDGWIVEDLGSHNGTFLDGRRIAEMRLGEPCILRLGDPDSGTEVMLVPVDSGRFASDAGAETYRPPASEALHQTTIIRR
ncbi:MAG: FHA domain-containing protein [Actinomycetes bacterium]